MERICCACRVEKDARPVGFNMLKTTYFLGPLCWASWSIEAVALADVINNVAKVHMTFQRWLKTRRVSA